MAPGRAGDKEIGLAQTMGKPYYYTEIFLFVNPFRPRG